MKTAIHGAIVGILAAAGVAGLSTHVRADSAGVASMAGVGAASGQEIYTRICQGCHMPNAMGAVGAGRYPALSGDPALGSWQYAAIRVLNGKGGMPAFGRIGGPDEFPRAVHLSDAQVAEVVNYVRGNFGNRFKGTVTTADVAALPHP